MKQLSQYLFDRLVPVLLLGVLLLMLPLAWFIWDAIHGVLQVLVAIFLMVAVHVRQLPPDWLWLLLVLLAAAHLLRTLGQEVSLLPAKPEVMAQAGPVQSWLDTLDLNRSPYQMGHIPLNRLQQVVLSALAQQEQSSLGAMRNRLRTGRLPLDPALQTFLQTGRSQLAPDRPVVEAPELLALLSLLGVKDE
jgi:hypothetical protein